MVVPMLDEDEFKVVSNLYRNGHFRTVREKYLEMTGFKETNENAIMHHRISIYGEPCENCGKPLRTPQAAFCAAFGQTV